MQNKVFLTGHVGQKPEPFQFDNGNRIIKFSLATTENYKDKTTGEKKKLTEWHNIVVFGKLVEIVEKYIDKGSLVQIEGKIKTRSYGDDSNKKYFTEIICTNLLMFPSKKAEQGAQNDFVSTFSDDDDGLAF